MPHNINDLKPLAHGHWDKVLSLLLPNISSIQFNPKKHQPCPIHGGKDGFRFFSDYTLTGGAYCNTCGSFPDGFNLLQRIHGWSFPKSLEEVANVLGCESKEYSKSTKATNSATETMRHNQQQEQEKLNQKALAQLNEVYASSFSIERTLPHSSAARYLINRGLNVILDSPPNDLRAHSNLQYFDSETRVSTNYHGMIALIRLPNGEPVGIHRTFLTESGFKAPVQHPKKLMQSVQQSATSGCAIQLYPAKHQLSVAEGIETALGVYQKYGTPISRSGRIVVTP